MKGEVSVAAATAVLGYDLFTGVLWRTAQRRRKLLGIACAGSAAAGDSLFALYIGTRRVGEFYNKATGFPTRDHLSPMFEDIPAGEQLTARVEDAPATNPINVDVFLD